MRDVNGESAVAKKTPGTIEKIAPFGLWGALGELSIPLGSHLGQLLQLLLS